MCSICKSPSLLFWVKQVCSYLNKNEFEDEYVYWIARGIQDVVQKKNSFFMRIIRKPKRLPKVAVSARLDVVQGA